MTTFVSPWIFYAVSVFTGVKTVAIVLSIFAGIATAVTVAVYALMLYDDYDFSKEDALKMKKRVKVIAPILVVVLLIAICVPDEKTMLCMLVAKNATIENANLTVDAIKSAVDYIVSAFSNLN